MQYETLYNIIGEKTPLQTDCGLLCGAACCAGDEETGMYLYPGEEELLKNVPFGKLVQSDFTYRMGETEKPVWLFVCNGTCDRTERPLACRVFPFVPYMDHGGNIEIVLDPRADRVCPLARHGDAVNFDTAFLDRLAEAFGTGLEDEAFLAFIKAQSELIDAWEDDLEAY